MQPCSLVENWGAQMESKIGMVSVGRNAVSHGHAYFIAILCVKVLTQASAKMVDQEAYF